MLQLITTTIGVNGVYCHDLCGSKPHLQHSLPNKQLIVFECVKVRGHGCRFWLLLLIGHLYLCCVWSRLDLGLDTRKTSGQRDWTKFSKIVHYSKFDSQHKGGGGIWSFNMESNLHSNNELNTHTSFRKYEGNCYILNFVFTNNLILMTHLIIVGENWTTSTIGGKALIFSKTS